MIPDFNQPSEFNSTTRYVETKEEPEMEANSPRQLLLLRINFGHRKQLRALNQPSKFNSTNRNVGAKGEACDGSKYHMADSH